MRGMVLWGTIGLSTALGAPRQALAAGTAQQVDARGVSMRLRHGDGRATLSWRSSRRNWLDLMVWGDRFQLVNRRTADMIASRYGRKFDALRVRAERGDGLRLEIVDRSGRLMHAQDLD